MDADGFWVWAIIAVGVAGGIAIALLQTRASRTAGPGCSHLESGAALEFIAAAATHAARANRPNGAVRDMWQRLDDCCREELQLVGAEMLLLHPSDERGDLGRYIRTLDPAGFKRAFRAAADA